LTPAEQDVFDSAVALRAVYDSGGKRKVGLGRPPYEPGERLLGRAMQMTARTVPLDATRASIETTGLQDGKGKFRPEGALMSTDRRAYLLGNFGKVLKTWEWSEQSKVAVIHGYLGVRFVRPADTTDCDAVLHCYNKLVVLDPSTAIIAKQLIAVEAAWVLGTCQDYDAWLVRLPLRFS